MTETTTDKPNGTATSLPAEAPPRKPPLVSGAKVTAIVPQDFESAYRLATVIVKAEMAPKSVNTVEKATVAILHGLEVGLTPMAALQSIAVVNGMPTIWGDGLLGLVQASGLLEEIVETVERDKDGSPLLAICRVKRVGRAQWTEQMFSRAEAQKAGLWSKQGPWTQYPRRMLQMRARGWALRDAFPDVLRGLHSAEEVSDIVDIGGHSTIPPEPTRAQFQTQQQQPDQQQTTDEQHQGVTDAQDENAGNPLVDGEEGWPLYDSDGETAGHFGVTEWLDELDKLISGLAPTPKARRQFLENNSDSAKAMLADTDVPEQVKATLRKRFEAFLTVAAK